MHSSSADVGLAVGSGGLRAGGDVRLLGLGLGAAAGLVQGGCGNEVLDDGAVAGELEGGSVGALRGRLRDDCLQHGALRVGLAISFVVDEVVRPLTMMVEFHCSVFPWS